MEKVKWLLEKNVFDDDLMPMLNELSKSGIEYNLVEHRASTRHEEVAALFGPQECVVFYGSLGMSNVVRKNVGWVPGLFCDLPKYECTYYYPRIGEHLLNENYTMLPFGEMTRRREWLMQNFGVDDKIFVRPSSPFKIFGGKVINDKEWEKEIKFLNFYTVEPEKVVIVASPKKVICEWRIVVVDGKGISGSQYIKNDEIVSGPCPDHVMEYANRVLSQFEYRPERVWCLDICEQDTHELKVLEVGAFSTCGLYQCPMEPIVREVSRVALEEWHEIYEDAL